MRVRGRFCRTSGNVTDEIIKNHIEGQSDDEADETFLIARVARI
jgi:hypothetical protein